MANFDERRIFGKSEGRKDANEKLNNPDQGKAGWRPALLESEWDVQKGPDAPKLEMPECLRTHLSTKPQRIEAPCRGERRLATWGLRRACRPGGVGLRRRGVAARAVGEPRLQFTSFVLN